MTMIPLPPEYKYKAIIEFCMFVYLLDKVPVTHKSFCQNKLCRNSDILRFIRHIYLSVQQNGQDV
jgi:hypothetical protein